MENEDRKIIYPTTWKPTLIKGVPRDYAIFALIVCAVFSAIIGQILIMFPLLVIAYVYGSLKAKEDPEFFTVYAVRLFKLKATKGEFKGREYVP